MTSERSTTPPGLVSPSTAAIATNQTSSTRTGWRVTVAARRCMSISFVWLGRNSGSGWGFVGPAAVLGEELARAVLVLAFAVTGGAEAEETVEQRDAEAGADEHREPVEAHSAVNGEQDRESGEHEHGRQAVADGVQQHRQTSTLAGARPASSSSIEAAKAATPSSSRRAVTAFRSTPVAAISSSAARAAGAEPVSASAARPWSRNAASVAGGIVFTTPGPASSSTYLTSL